MFKVNIKNSDGDYIKFLKGSIISLLLLLTACDAPTKLMRDEDDKTVPEFMPLETETKVKYYFFGSDKNLNFTQSTLNELKELLKHAKAVGDNNVEFMVISSSPVSIDTQLRVKKQIEKLMCRCRFLKSRIVYKGACVYTSAKTGLRVGIPKYEFIEPDGGLWKDFIGDIDTDKKIPKYGASQIYNMEAMIDNKADFTDPREYPGMRATAAIDALGGEEGSSSSSSSSSDSTSSESSSSSS